MKNNPLVSIVIPTHNRADLLPRALNSAMNQTYKNIEIIVCDDGSTDNTEDIVKEFLKKDSRIKYIKNEKNLGGNITRNKGILASLGEFITMLDDDDEFVDDRIELLINSYDDRYSFVTTRNLFLLKDSNWCPKIKEEINFQYMLYGNGVGNSVLVKKERIVDVGMFDEKLESYQDHEMWLRLIHRYGVAKCLKDITLVIHWENNLPRVSQSEKKYKAYMKVYKKYKTYMDDSARSYWLNQIYFSKKGKNDKNLKYYHLALKVLKSKILKMGIKSLSVYGAGEVLDELYEFFIENNISINYIVDRDKRGLSKYGKTIVNIHQFAKTDEKYILIASYSYTLQMRENIKKYTKNMQIIMPY